MQFCVFVFFSVPRNLVDLIPRALFNHSKNGKFSGATKWMGGGGQRHFCQFGPKEPIIFYFGQN